MITALEIKEIEHAIRTVHGPCKSIVLLHKFERVLRAAGVLVQTPEGLVHASELPRTPTTPAAG